jgi:hypothetical protein
MKKTSLIPLTMVCIIALLSMSTIAVQAGVTPLPGPCVVWTTDTLGNPKGSPSQPFSPGETVMIHWQWSGPSGPMDINVTAPDGRTLDAIWLGLNSVTGQEEFTPNHGSGWYTIYANQASTHIIVGGTPFFVVPELPLGVMMAVVAGFAALGTLKLKRRRD